MNNNNKEDLDLFTSRSAKQKSDQAFDIMIAMLKHMHKRDDIQPIAREIRENFGSATAMFRANRTIWRKLGLRPNDALLFSHMLDITRYVERDSFGNYPRIGNLYDASRYMLANAFGLQVECFYLFCVDKRGGMKERILLQRGTDDSALFSLRRMLSEVVRVKPNSVIISHNHPGGTLRPSQDDIDCTIEAIRALSVLNVPLLDHVIIAAGEAVSLRENGFIPESIWINQNPEHRQLQRWFLRPGEKPAPKRSPKKKTDA